MNKLFEEYVGRMAAKVLRPLGYDVRLQDARHHLVYDEMVEREVFRLKPDVVGRVDEKAAWIIDTKWKTLSQEESRDGVAQLDMYQMYAYSQRYDCPDVVLMYPHHAGLGATGGARRTYRVRRHMTGSDESYGRIRVATIDLSDLRTVPDQIRAIIGSQRGQTPLKEVMLQ